MATGVITVTTTFVRDFSEMVACLMLWYVVLAQPVMDYLPMMITEHSPGAMSSKVLVSHDIFLVYPFYVRYLDDYGCIAYFTFRKQISILGGKYRREAKPKSVYELCSYYYN